MATQFLDVEVKPRLNVAEWNKILKQLESSLGPLASGIKPLDASGAFLKPLEDVGRKLRETGEETDRFGKKGAALGKAFQFNMIIDGLRNVKEIVSGLSEPFVRLDTATARIKTLGGDAKALAGDFRDLSVEMSQKIPISAGEMQTALYDALSAGIKPTRDGIESFMTSAGKLAVGGMESIGSTVNLLSSITNAYGLAAETAGESSDFLFQTVNLGKTTIPELNQSMSQVIPTAAAMGVNLKNVGANLALMTANGIPTTQATTKLNQLLIELQKGSKDLDPYLKKAGVSLSSLANEDLIENLARLRGEFDKSGKSATQIFGSSEASAAFNVLTKDISAARGMLSQMDNAAGSTEAAYQEMAGTIENRSAAMKAKFEAFVIGAIDKTGALGTAVVSGTKILGEMQAPIMALAGLKAVIPTAQIGQLATSLVTKFVPAAVITNTATGATSISMKALAASTWAAIVPMAPYIAAVAALGVAIYAIDGGFKQSAKSKLEDAEAQMKSNKQTQEAIVKSRDTNQSNLVLINSTTELAKKEGKSAEEKEKLKINLDKLHKTYPDVITDTSNMDGVLISLGKSARDVVGNIGQYNKKLSDTQQAYKELRTIAIEAEFEMGSEVFQPGFLKAMFGSSERFAEIKMVGESIQNRLRETKSQEDVNKAMVYANDLLKRHNMATKEYAEGLEIMINARRKYFKQEQTELAKPDGGGGDDGTPPPKPEAKTQKDLDEDILNVKRETARIRGEIQAKSLEDERDREVEAAKVRNADQITQLELEIKKYNDMKDVEAGDKEKMLEALNGKMSALTEQGQSEIAGIIDKWNKKITEDEKEENKKRLENKKKLDKQQREHEEEIEKENEDKRKNLISLQEDLVSQTASQFENFTTMILVQHKSFLNASALLILDNAKNVIAAYIPEITAKSVAMLGPIAGPIAAGVAVGALYGILEWAKSAIQPMKEGTQGEMGRNRVVLLNDAAGYPYEEFVMPARPAAKNWRDLLKISQQDITLEEHIIRNRPDILSHLAQTEKIKMSLTRDREMLEVHKKFYIEFIAGEGAGGVESNELRQLSKKVEELTKETREQKELIRKMLRLDNDWMNKDIKPKKKAGKLTMDSGKMVVELEEMDYRRRVRAGG